MKILLTGREGQVAWELRRTLACLGEVVALDRHSTPLSLDLANPDSIRMAVWAVKPDLIVNAAAYTGVDQAEQDRNDAYAVNARAPGILAEQALKWGAGIIHYSTDYVFSGEAKTPYLETDATGPQGVYGNRGRNFLLTMLRLMRERELVRVVNDQFGAPTWSRLIAEATALLIARSLENDRFAPGKRSGIYHLSCGGEASWFEFAQTIREAALACGLLTEPCARLEAIPGSEYPTPAKRPAYSVLSNDKLAESFGLALPDWRDALSLCLADAQCLTSG